MTTGEALPAEVRQGRIRSYVNAQEFARVADISERVGVGVDVTVVPAPAA